MTQEIDQLKLKQSAEHLAWVLRQYSDDAAAQQLLDALLPIISQAEAGLITTPLERAQVPGAFDFGDGRYVRYRDPDLGEAYAIFVTELEGGLSEQDKRRLADMEAYRLSLLEKQR